MKMKKTCLFFLLILMLVLPQAALAVPAGVVTRTEGKVDITRAGLKAAKPLHEGESVDMGDIIRTKSRSKAEIVFSNKNTLRIAASTRVVIQHYMVKERDSRAVMQLQRGMVQVVSSVEFIKRLVASPKDNKLEVNTANAVCGIRGSNMIVSYRGGVTSVLFVTGKGYTYNPIKPDVVVPITAGHITFIEKRDATPTQPRPVSELDVSNVVNTVTPSDKTKKDQEQGQGTDSSSSKAGDTSSGKSDAARGKSGTSPGLSGTSPGLSGTSPGLSGTSPGLSVMSPGQSGTSPGLSGTSPGLSGTTPGLSGTSPGQSGISPGLQRGHRK
jgi:hypothetical protein